MKLEKANLEEYLALQDTLNGHTCGVDWKNGICEKTGRSMNFKLALGLELAEYLDSYNWKHWKDVSKEDDIENAKMELVDVWHFILSLVLQHGADVDLILAQDDVPFPYDVVDIDSAFKATVDINSILLPLGDAITNSEGDTAGRFALVIQLFSKLMEFTGFSPEELRKIYLLKNTLNVFRVNNGYADGTYIKVWDNNTAEDNVVLMRLTEYADEISFDSLYSLLEGEYVKVLEEAKAYNEYRESEANNGKS